MYNKSLGPGPISGEGCTDVPGHEIGEYHKLALEIAAGIRQDLLIYHLKEDGLGLFQGKNNKFCLLPQLHFYTYSGSRPPLTLISGWVVGFRSEYL